MVEGVAKVDLRLPKERRLFNAAPVWKRISSFIIDMFIIEFIIFGPFTSFFQSRLPVSSDTMANFELISSNQDTLASLYPVFAVLFLLIFAYFVIFEYSLKQTPGKMMLRIYVSHLIKNEKISFIQILIRNVAIFPIFPFIRLWIIDPLYLIFTGKRLSDIFSKTQVTEETLL